MVGSISRAVSSTTTISQLSFFTKFTQCNWTREIKFLERHTKTSAGTLKSEGTIQPIIRTRERRRGYGRVAYIGLHAVLTFGRHRRLEGK